ncbi:MAG: hypothetical protein MK171_03475 [Pirellulales bacterium]|nr:hypothetical protein [Pirellulales bacterium]
MRTPAKVLSSDIDPSDDPNRLSRKMGPSTPALVTDRVFEGDCLRRLDTDNKIVVGNAGDHPLVLQLFAEAYQTQLAEDFQSRLDEPSYEPSDRLLLKHGKSLIGHVQVSKLFGWFQGQRCPIARLQDFLTLPEYRSAALDGALLETAEGIALDEGSILALVRTERPEWLSLHGWSRCRGLGHTRANTRAILTHFDTPSHNIRRSKTTLEVRAWRHFELDALQRIYGQLSTNMWGALHRSLENWQWLAGRRAHDQILIALANKTRKSSRLSDMKLAHVGAETPEDGPPQCKSTNVVGYAVIRDSCIVEMLTLPGYSRARTLLVERACRDAIDHDHHFVSLHTPASDPMHELLVAAGGSWIGDGATTTGTWMMKLLAPNRWIKRFYTVLHERAREADIPRPLEIDFTIGNIGQQLTLTRRSSRLEEKARTSQAQLCCDWHTFQDLLTSNLTFPEAVAEGRLIASHDSVLQTLAALFPPKLFWQSPFSLLRL